MNDRATKISRKRMVLDMLSNCLSPSLIVSQLAMKEGCTERAVWGYLREVREELREANTRETREIYLPQAIAQAERHYMRCIAAGQLAVGLATLKWLGELHGIAPAATVQQNVNVQNNQILDYDVRLMSDADIRERLDMLRAQQDN